MLDECLPMGCLSSRSTTVSPVVESGQAENGANSRGGGGEGGKRGSGDGTTTKGMANGIQDRATRKGPAGANGYRMGSELERPKDNYSDSGTTSKQKRIVNIGTSLDRQSASSNQSDGAAGGKSRREQENENENGTNEEDEFMTILMNGNSSSERNNLSMSRSQIRSQQQQQLAQSKATNRTPNSRAANNNKISTNTTSKMDQAGEHEETFDELDTSSYSPNETNSSDKKGEAAGSDLPDGEENQPGTSTTEDSATDQVAVAIPNDKSIDAESGETSFEEELNVDLLRQYIAVDYEISQLEDRDALRLYHEKIEQLEQLERELDMISFEAEEVAVRSETDMSQGEPGNHMSTTSGSGLQKDSKMDTETNSIMSGVSGSLSAKSSIVRRQDNQGQSTNNSKRVLASGTMAKMPTGKQQQQQNNAGGGGGSHKGSEIRHGLRQLDKSQRFTTTLSNNKDSNLSYATIEEVFNRKIILEKERDKLKKEVEMVIIECDRLQQKYKKRDEILDKLFDGRTGNGLENHLEQQLNWLMEQKHYVDQVFYAWKRAETLTSQTCEQFASALELLKRLPKTQNEEQRNELSKSVCNLLIKSRQDMEQAQRYNPNVDAPFFTEAETERFDKIIETMQSSSISQSEYNQMATVVQFAYKRAVSIRLWLEQILQITIARDSFELAEEYKWIAIQLRKERISLINLKLQDPPYRAMAQAIRDQLASQNQRQQQLDHASSARQLAITDGGMVQSATGTRNRQNEINRDSGIESDGIDIEEDIYRLLEMNKSRLEAAVAASRGAGALQQGVQLDSNGRPVKPLSVPSSTSTSGLTGGNRQQQQLSVATGAGGAGSSHRATGNSSSMRMSSQHDQIMRERIQRRVRGEQPLALSQTGVGVGPLGEPGLGVGAVGAGDFGQHDMDVVSNPNKKQQQQRKRDGADGAGAGEDRPSTGFPTETPQTSQSNALSKQDGPQSSSSVSQLTPSKLRIQLDEESRRSLLKQVDQIHSKHRNKLDNLRGNNKAKANDILQRLQSSKQQTKEEQDGREA